MRARAKARLQALQEELHTGHAIEQRAGRFLWNSSDGVVGAVGMAMCLGDVVVMTVAPGGVASEGAAEARVEAAAGAA